MAVLPIRLIPDAVLRVECPEVTAFDDELRRLVDDMVETMHAAPGVGLAAPQVGVEKRLALVDVTVGKDPTALLVLVNPEIVEESGSLTWNEGCLSVPDFQADVERSGEVVLRATDLDGKPVEIRAEGLQAVCFQHEIDHLDGVLFIDRISRLKREMYVRKRKKQLRQEELEAG